MNDTYCMMKENTVPTPEELMLSSARLQSAVGDCRQSIVRFVLAPGNDHPEGNAWFSIIETNLAAAHGNMLALQEALKDCAFARARAHITLATALVFGCRYITEHCVQVRHTRLPDAYNDFMRDSNSTLGELNGYMHLLKFHIEEEANV